MCYEWYLENRKRLYWEKCKHCFFRLQTQRNKYFKMSYSSAAKYIPYMSISEFSFDKTQLYRQQLQECLNVKQFLEKSIESKPVFYDGIYNSLKGEWLSVSLHSSNCLTSVRSTLNHLQYFISVQLNCP